MTLNVILWRNISASNNPIEITIIKINKIYFGAFEVNEKTLFGSKFFSI